MASKKNSITDGKIILTLQDDEDGWYTVTSPTDPAMITQAKSIPDAFRMARDAFAALASSRSDPQRWERATSRRMKRSA